MSSFIDLLKDNMWVPFSKLHNQHRCYSCIECTLSWMQLMRSSLLLTQEQGQWNLDQRVWLLRMFSWPSYIMSQDGHAPCNLYSFQQLTHAIFEICGSHSLVVEIIHQAPCYPCEFVPVSTISVTLPKRSLEAYFLSSILLIPSIGFLMS